MIIAANWKMNPQLWQAEVLADTFTEHSFPKIKRILFPPHPFLAAISGRLSESGVIIGGQDCHFASQGAYTGDVSAAMLRDCGASMVLLGHSERRAAHGETSDQVAKKAEVALAQNLHVMLCVGETLVERNDGQAHQVIIDQLQASIPASMHAGDLTIAYEPVWAIGSGTMASPRDIELMHAVISGFLEERFVADDVPPILYGGSVNSKNASVIFSISKVSGALVGGASLDAKEFVAICAAANAREVPT